MYQRLSAREMILHATKQLLWEKGFAAMSPKMVMKASGAGQGSLYHHFEGKLDLASHALQEVRDDLLTYAGDHIFRPNKSASQQVLDYLTLPREALKGCRMGRMAYDAEVTDSALRMPVNEYFQKLQSLLQPCLKTMMDESKLKASSNAEALAATCVATVQGAYILALANQDTTSFDRAIEGLCSLLNLSP